MKARQRAVCVLAAVALGLGAGPSVASADPVVDEAVAQLNDLGLVKLTGMPSGRTTYRTYDEIQAELEALAATYPTKVAVKEAPYKSIEGRTIKYIEVTNNVHVKDGKPAFFLMGAIHGNETPSAEVPLEFVYDVLLTGQSNPKVAALLDKVRMIVMPVTNADGHARNRRTSCGGTITPPNTCSATNAGVDLNRNYPFGWGSNIGANFNTRGPGPGSEPEVKNTMEIVKNNQVVNLITAHTNTRAIFYPGLDVFAGDTPDLNNGYRDLALALAAQAGYTNVRRSALDYETSGETVDWSYYATRGFANTLELVGSVSGCPQSMPNYLNCTTADYTGTPGPTSSTAQTNLFNNHPVRNLLYLALVYTGLSEGHSVIKGTAQPGATLKITKDFDLYTAPIRNNTTPATTSPPQAIPTHLESTIEVPASGEFTWSVNPSIRPRPAFEADGEHAGPRGFITESWTISCIAPDGTVLDTNQVTVDKGEVAYISLCEQTSVGGTVPATLSLQLGAPASFGNFIPGLAQEYTASSTATVTSTAGDAALSVADPSTTATGHLVNGEFSLPSALQASANDGAFAPVPGSANPLTLLTYSGPVSNDGVTLNFKQQIGATDALRTGTYAKTLTFTLSTTNP
jgi:hypothetical protein